MTELAPFGGNRTMAPATHRSHREEGGLFPAAPALLALFALAATAAAQRVYQGVPVVKEGTTVRISPHVYVIPDESARGVPNVGIVVGTRATLVTPDTRSGRPRY